MFKYILKKFFKYRTSYIFIFMIIITYLISAISPYLAGSFVDFLLINNDERKVVTFATIIMLAGIMGVLLSYVKNMISVKITSQVSFDILRDVTKYLKRVKLEIIETKDPMRLIQQINTDVNVTTNFVMSNFIALFMNLLLATWIVYLFCSISMILLAMMFALIIPYMFLYIKLRNPLYQQYSKKKEADSRFFSKLSSQISQIFNIQLHSLYESSDKEFQNAFRQYLPVIICTRKMEYFFSSIDNIIAAIFQAIMFVLGGISIIKGNMTIGEFTMVNTYFGYFLKIVKYYIGFMKELQDAKASYSRILNILNYDTIKNGEEEIIRLDEISAKNIGFFYQTKEKRNVILNKFSYDFYSGNIYSIIGPNGCGKSTLLKVITGLYTDIEGILTINGIRIGKLNGEKLRKEKYSVVPQRIYITSDNVVDYLKKSLDKTVEELYSLLEYDKEKLPEYVKTIYECADKKCENLSCGELRKINLWMAFHKSADIIILDEPTMELDKESKRELFDYLDCKRQDKLLIVITHDIELMELSDYIVDLGTG